jgi:hypothetical protein
MTVTVTRMWFSASKIFPSMGTAFKTWHESPGPIE